MYVIKSLRSSSTHLLATRPNSKKNQLSSHEIVPEGPMDVFVDMDPIVSEDSSQFTAYQEDSKVQYVWEPYDSERLPETLASGIQRFLRVANLVESEEPRTAYLCRFYTFEEAHRIDPRSTGRGVRQFKNSLLRMLEKDDGLTLGRRKNLSDFGELKRVYNSQLEKLINARRIASVLYEILQKNQDDETGELLDMVTLMEETQQKNSDGTSVDKKAELIVEKCKSLEEERLTHMSQGDDSVQPNHLSLPEIDAIYKEEVQIKKGIQFGYGSIEDNLGPSSTVPSSLYEDKYLEIQKKLNKAEKKIEAMDLKFKDLDFWTSMMQNLFPDQVPPSVRANQTEKNKHNKLSL